MFAVLARLVKDAALRGWRTAPLTLGWPPDASASGAELIQPRVGAPVRDVPRQLPGPGTNQESHDMSQVQAEPKPMVTRNQALGWLRQMMLIRRFEERAEMMYQKQKIG